MFSERTFYAVVLAIVVVGGISIGAAFDFAASNPQKASSLTSTTLNLIIVPSGWYANKTIAHDQPAFVVVAPNGSLESSASIQLPSHELITLTIVDYDSYGLSPNLGINGTSNDSTYAKVTGTVGGSEYVYNGTNVNVTLPTNTSNNISIPSGFAVTDFPWIGNSTGGYDIAHTFTIYDSSAIFLNLPSPGMSTLHAQFYLNQTGSFLWQCYVPCGNGNAGWGGAMSTTGWMAGTITVS
ncbi:MAG: hypothetical protein M1151_01820 [Candidatus Thermoplasmatota archaeon]|jgi:hypothetical protein|nr:hypothetical protein [Candidatus Thermoplasmatota archaeon]